MLVIATPNPDSIAETFIRQHIRLLEPGKTAVIYFEGEGSSIKDLPSFKVDRHEAGSKLQSIKSLLLYGYTGALIGEQKRSAISFLKDNQVSCVLAEFGQTACALMSTCQQAGTPLYVFFHGHDASAAGRKFVNRYSYWRMGRYASKVFVATHYFADKVTKVGIPGKKIFVAPYGLEVEEFTPAEVRDYNLVLAVGRMVEKKAPHLTIQAFSKVLKEVPNARLEMVGEGPLLELAKETARNYGLESSVIFHGSKTHEFVKEKVSSAAIFVQHSLTAPNGDTESLGVSLLEAMSCEVPIVTTRHNGFVETVEDGVTGYLVEERDIDKMAKYIIEILNDRGLRNEMGKAGRERVKKNYESNQQAKLLKKLLNI
ncbi:MAG: glycosyltransferase family 4 protein [Arenicellales bacterium]